MVLHRCNTFLRTRNLIVLHPSDGALRSQKCQEGALGSLQNRGTKKRKLHNSRQRSAAQGMKHSNIQVPGIQLTRIKLEMHIGRRYAKPQHATVGP